jgi:mitochondrial FAD-linked sulfhydryl oxidase
MLWSSVFIFCQSQEPVSKGNIKLEGSDRKEQDDASPDTQSADRKENSPFHLGQSFSRLFDKEHCGVCGDIRNWAKQAQRQAFETTEKIFHSTQHDAQMNNGSSYEPFPCPANAETLGQSTWMFLHTMAAYYPEHPTSQEQKRAAELFHALADLYPCHICAEHLKDELQVSPPQTESSKAFSKWLCDLHNQVNVLLGKPIFDCSKVFERWKNAGSSSKPECK